MPAGENWRMHKADTLAEMRGVFECPYFYFGWQEAAAGEPLDPDRVFQLVRGYDQKSAQLKYENGREAAIEARVAGVNLTWPQRAPAPLRLLVWAVAGIEP